MKQILRRVFAHHQRMANNFSTIFDVANADFQYVSVDPAGHLACNIRQCCGGNFLSSGTVIPSDGNVWIGRPSHSSSE